MKLICKILVKSGLLLMSLWLDSCNQKQDNTSGNPTPISGINPGKLWVSTVAANTDGLAMIASDSVSQDVLMVYGNAKNDGSLRPLSRITRLKKNSDFVSVRFAEGTFLPAELTITSKSESVTIKLINVYQYDGTIDFDVTNNVTAKTGSVKAYKLAEQSFNKLVKAQDSYSANFKSARLASTSCSIFSTAGSVLEAIECAFTIDPIPAITPVIGTSLDKVLIPVLIQDCKTALTNPIANEVCNEYAQVAWEGITSACQHVVDGGAGTSECYAKIAQLVRR